MQEVPIDLYELPERASDGVSDLLFNPKNDRELLASSWDGSVRLYQVQTRSKIDHWTLENSVPVLSCAWYDGKDGICGSVDGSVRLLRRGGTHSILGTHSAGVRRVCTSQKTNCIYSGSWDRSVSVWDLRVGPKHKVESIDNLDGKVFAMCLSEANARPSLLVVGTSTMQICIFDTRELSRGPISIKPSPLKHQTRCLAPFPNGMGFAISSIEGRIAIEYFDQAHNIAPDTTDAILDGVGGTPANLKYAFKCHRDNQGIVYPVNALAFHPLGSFASGGTDKRVNMWDPFAKRRLCQLPDPFPSSISALSFSPNGSYLAIASSYNFEQGEFHPSHTAQPPDQIFIHTPLPYQVTPKQLTTTNTPPSSTSSSI
mmetsp:Transcript_22026/g.26498  ORF Transcript_22026/g.26498 Transcript_22026/m.26498 type:complete len:371 (-) Transcript_22026:204-1316(-)|eukprot:CAMPEP_0197304760 /NCGR_PEP_ID=MMETSP0891-20130614/402_1 /TAXON_ID=44058 ORGANISM="Aureoumbra lagunensis, Strain CCMP1510" /NCGR_SAMPLE_ID=MMETSP0891 /ASSEMBLY_ACC=CAM_ASM_000534 /LENGTH=370 /DNA_ID=CAMNT_0042785057 /DNA_START=100 /DNA_END=1212 /DNA_ORIENTATION=-